MVLETEVMKRRNMIKKCFLIMAAIMVFSGLSWAQDMASVLNQAAQIYAGSETSSNNLIGGFSVPGMIGGILFGSIGFVAFMYGKKNALFKPIMIGILLMAYPYFLRGTLAIYLVGVGLTAALYIFRE